MFDVQYEWVTYKDKETQEEKKCLVYYLFVGETKIRIKGADSKNNNYYNQKLLDSARKLGLIKKVENE